LSQRPPRPSAQEVRRTDLHENRHLDDRSYPAVSETGGVAQRASVFPVSIPNEETVKAMMEANDAAALKGYRSFQKLREQI
jgi:hypothetical protein